MNLKTELAFDSLRSLKNTWESYEEKIYEGIGAKVKSFISDLEGENFMPDKPNDGCNGYVLQMIGFLGLMYGELKQLSQTYIENSFLAGISSISKYYMEILLNANTVKAFNYYAMVNLKQDIDELQSYLNDLAINSEGNY